MAQTHDFGPGRRCRGHDYTITETFDSGRLYVLGWGHDDYTIIQTGDYLLLDAGDGHSTRYQVEEIDRVMDPDDTWYATLAPRPAADRRRTDQPPTDTNDVRPGPGWCDYDNEDHAYTLAPCTRERQAPPPSRV